MTKADLIDIIALKMSLTKREADIFVNTVFDSIVSSLKEGDKVELRGFGSFRIRDRRARDGRNPKSGEKVSIPAKKVPFFKAGKEFKEIVDN